MRQAESLKTTSQVRAVVEFAILHHSEPLREEVQRLLPQRERLKEMTRFPVVQLFLRGHRLFVQKAAN